MRPIRRSPSGGLGLQDCRHREKGTGSVKPPGPNCDRLAPRPSVRQRTEGTGRGRATVCVKLRNSIPLLGPAARRVFVVTTMALGDALVTWALPRMRRPVTTTYGTLQVANACSDHSFSRSPRRPAVQCNYLRCREFALNQLEKLQERPESGQGMVEYALILVLIAVVVIVILTTVGHRVNNIFSNISHGLST